MKEMYVNKPVIENDIKQSMAQAMLDQKLYKNGWIYNKYIQLVYYDSTRKTPYTKRTIVKYG